GAAAPAALLRGGAAGIADDRQRHRNRRQREHDPLPPRLLGGLAPLAPGLPGAGTAPAPARAPGGAALRHPRRAGGGTGPGPARGALAPGRLEQIVSGRIREANRSET